MVGAARASLSSGLTKALVLSRAGGEAVVALACVAAAGVEAAPVLTDARLGLTLILICGVRGKSNHKSSHPTPLPTNGVCLLVCE